MEAEVKRWLGGNAYGFVQEFDVQRSKNAVRAIAFEQPPASVNLLISECLHNLRSALDNLIYDLALAYNGGNPLPPAVEKAVMFPIFQTRKEFKDSGAWRIKDIDPGAQAVIEELQPYERGNPALLWELHELSRVDKHRLLNVTLLGMHESVFGGHGNIITNDVTFGGGAIEPFGSGAVDGTELVSYRATPIDPSDKMGVYFQFGFGIAFGQASPVSAGEPVLRRLRTLRDYTVNTVIPLLAPYLTQIRVVRVSHARSPLPPVLPPRG
ncbi:MAG: hypothetical protein M3118_08375 [Actinomycetota bacterium]|nr:hypothetical protein [Actinomycetota bacterium]